MGNLETDIPAVNGIQAGNDIFQPGRAHANFRTCYKLFFKVRLFQVEIREGKMRLPVPPGLDRVCRGKQVPPVPVPEDQ